MTKLYQICTTGLLLDLTPFSFCSLCFSENFLTWMTFTIWITFRKWSTERTSDHNLWLIPMPAMFKTWGDFFYTSNVVIGSYEPQKHFSKYFLEQFQLEKKFYLQRKVRVLEREERFCRFLTHSFSNLTENHFSKQ